MSKDYTTERTHSKLWATGCLLLLIVISLAACNYRYNTGYFLPGQRPAELKTREIWNRFADSLGDWEGSAYIYMITQTNVNQRVTPNTFGITVAFTDTTHDDYARGRSSGKECAGNYYPTVMVDSARLRCEALRSGTNLVCSHCYESPGYITYWFGETVLPPEADSIPKVRISTEKIKGMMGYCS